MATQPEGWTLTRVEQERLLADVGNGWWIVRSERFEDPNTVRLVSTRNGNQFSTTHAITKETAAALRDSLTAVIEDWPEPRDHQVWRDQKPESPVLTENECFAWLLRHQGQSIDWACRYEGWEIRKIEEATE